MADINAEIVGSTQPILGAFAIQVGSDYVPPTTIDASFDSDIEPITGVLYVEVESTQPTFGVPQLLNMTPYNVSETSAYAICNVYYPVAVGDVVYQSTSLLDGSWVELNGAVIDSATQVTLADLASSQIRTASDYWWLSQSGTTVNVRASLKSLSGGGDSVQLQIVDKNGNTVYGEQNISLTLDFVVYEFDVVMPVSADLMFRLRNGGVDEKTIGFQYISVIDEQNDVLAPTVVAASVNAAGTSLTINFSENVSGSTGFSLTADGASVSLSNLSINGSVATYVIGQVYTGETVLLSMSSGDFVDAAGNTVADFSNFEVTNNSAIEDLTTLYESTSLSDGTWSVGSGAVIVDSDTFTLDVVSTSRIFNNVANSFSVTAGTTVRITAYVRDETDTAQTLNIRLMNQGASTVWGEITPTLTGSFAAYSFETEIPAGQLAAVMMLRNGQNSAKTIGFQSVKVEQV